MILFVVLASFLLRLTDGSWGQSCDPGKLEPAFEALFNLDVNNMHHLLNISYQLRPLESYISVDPLFRTVQPQVLERFIVTRFIALVEDYHRGRPLDMSKKHQFLNAIMDTAVMQNLKRYLPNVVNLRNELDHIWFTTYRRRAPPLSSGFSHVFAGEEGPWRVGGFHNWITFHKEEAAGNLQYLRGMKLRHLRTPRRAADAMAVKFTWRGKSKPFGSLLVGTSPEFEMAVYTLCFFECPNQKCPVKVGGERFKIQTYEQTVGHYKYVGTAYVTDL